MQGSVDTCFINALFIVYIHHSLLILALMSTETEMKNKIYIGIFEK